MRRYLCDTCRYLEVADCHDHQRDAVGHHEVHQVVAEGSTEDDGIQRHISRLENSSTTHMKSVLDCPW